jgi:hypothetical protein
MRGQKNGLPAGRAQQPIALMGIKEATRPESETEGAVQMGFVPPIVVPLVRLLQTTQVRAPHREVAELFQYHSTPSSDALIHIILPLQGSHDAITSLRLMKRLSKFGRLNAKRMLFLRIGMDEPYGLRVI